MPISLSRPKAEACPESRESLLLKPTMLTIFQPLSTTIAPRLFSLSLSLSELIDLLPSQIDQLLTTTILSFPSGQNRRKIQKIHRKKFSKHFSSNFEKIHFPDSFELLEKSYVFPTVKSCQYFPKKC